MNPTQQRALQLIGAIADELADRVAGDEHDALHELARIVDGWADCRDTPPLVVEDLTQLALSLHGCDRRTDPPEPAHAGVQE